jgi:hypothetical protein
LINDKYTAILNAILLIQSAIITHEEKKPQNEHDAMEEVDKQIHPGVSETLRRHRGRYRVLAS